MSPRKHNWSDSPDWEYVREEAEQAITAYCEWLGRAQRDPNASTTPLLATVGEALITLGDFVGISVHIYGKEVVVSPNKA